MTQVLSTTQGVASWSHAFIWQEFVMFCTGNDPIKDAAFTTYANGHGLWFKSLLGSYGGKTERSFMMALKDFQEHRISDHFCKQEESILILGTAKSSDMSLPAKLVYLGDGREEPLGRLYEVGMEYAKRQAGWTHDPMTGKWYVCEERTTRKQKDYVWSKEVKVLRH